MVPTPPKIRRCSVFSSRGLLALDCWEHWRLRSLRIISCGVFSGETRVATFRCPPRRWCTNVTWITKVASELGKVIIIQVDEIVDCTSPSDFNFQLSTDSLASCFLPHVRLPRWPNKCRCSCWRCPSWWGWGVHSLLTYSVPVKNRCLLPNFKRSKLILWMDKSDKALSKSILWKVTPSTTCESQYQLFLFLSCS